MQLIGSKHWRNPGRGLAVDAAALLRVVNAFLAKWLPEKGVSGALQGLEYVRAGTRFVLSREVWEGLDAGFRRDFVEAQQPFKRGLDSCVNLAKVLTIMMVNLERKKRIWLKENSLPTDAPLSDALRQTPLGRVLENGGYAPPADWPTLLQGFTGGGRGGAARGAASKKRGRAPLRGRVTERAVHARAPPPFLARNLRRATARGGRADGHVNKKRAGFRVAAAGATKIPKPLPRLRGVRLRGKTGKQSAARQGTSAPVPSFRFRPLNMPNGILADGAAASGPAGAGAGPPSEGDQLREAAVCDVAKMFKAGVMGILRDGAKRAREECPEIFNVL
ncbi:hypothetical protein KFL_000750120 [Klebsormidium nitens]|uniref:Uncharacterized protein n=1 Tax=Klebsormidium nitens TaxID=105231 RepID=A0A0U9HLH3_KLENI|nr:hypothetical protein KFL_000750120 [Klebsormidium nitens]|eukprot:GAQ81243.1 hypothetical protein KFL_000750120 [Klebsormidium nitens]